VPDRGGSVAGDFELYGWAAATAASYGNRRGGLDPKSFSSGEPGTQDQVED
jgi:hypothetical protein